MRKLITQQFFILLLGTVFAWTNFAVELSDWLNEEVCTAGCSIGMKNPFLTPCFFGALFFAVAFVYSIIIRRKVMNGEK